MILGLIWSSLETAIWDKGYPDSYLLGPDEGRFSDFTCRTLSCTYPDPYEDPFAVYAPAAFVFFKLLSFSDRISLILFCFGGVASLALLLTRLLQPTVPGAWTAVSLAFLFLGLSYPLMVCLYCGNLEIVIAPLVGWAAYLYSRHRDVAGTFCLFPAICFKFYPVILLVIVLRRKKLGLFVASIIGTVVVTVSCLNAFAVPPGEVWKAYSQNLGFFRDYYLLNNGCLECSASLWNTYKLVLVGLQNLALIPLINFDFDGPFICASDRIYSILFGLIGFLCGAYAWLYERKLARAILMLLLFISISVPSGPDYRLMFASMALVILALLPGRRRGDWTALVLIALALIPKKEVFLTSVGTTETGFADVSIQVLVNPPCLLTAMAILLYNSGHPVDWRAKLGRVWNLLLTRWQWI